MQSAMHLSTVNYYLNINHTNYFAQTDFYVLENFHHTFSNLVVPPTDRTANALVPCKVRLVL